jgi:hypothetical protein
MNRLRWILVLMLVNGLAPGIAEAMEAAVHLVKTGHVAHSIAGEEDLGEQGPEHSCGATFHHCDCCAGSPGTAAARAELRTPGSPPSMARQTSILEFSRRALEPPFRPPIH